MFNLSPSVRIFVCTKPIDMRLSFNGLFGLVQSLIHQDAFSGHLFLFRSRRGNFIKVLWWDIDGWAIFAKRLEVGTFRFPDVRFADGQYEPIEIERAELLMLLRSSLSALQSQLEKSNATIAGLSEQLKETLQGNAELRALLVDLQTKLDKLLAQRKKRNRENYGPKTERHNPKPAASDSPAQPPAVEPITDPKHRNHKKHIHFQNLPTDPVPHKVKAEDLMCPNCTVETVFVGNEITYQLEKVIHSLKRLQHEQEVRACPKCKQYIVTVEKPCPPIPGGLPGPCLLGTTIVEKCADGLPQYRQSKILKREDAIIPRSTLCDWFQSGSLTIEPLYERLKRQVLASKVIQTDDCLSW